MDKILVKCKVVLQLHAILQIKTKKTNIKYYYHTTYGAYIHTIVIQVHVQMYRTVNHTA